MLCKNKDLTIKKSVLIFKKRSRVIMIMILKQLILTAEVQIREGKLCQIDAFCTADHDLAIIASVQELE
jgi:hypothetical protein